MYPYRNFCWLFLLLFLAAPALAQPRAPITWGNVEVISEGQPSYNINEDNPSAVYAKGDTICLGYGFGRRSGGPVVLVRVSGNNGVSWSPWQAIYDTSGGSHGDNVSFTSTTEGIFAAIDNQGNNPRGTRLHRTTDLGQTWTVQATTFNGDVSICATLGDTVVLSGANAWLMTTNYGTSYSTPRFLFTRFYSRINPLRLTATRQWLYALMRVDLTSDPPTYFCFQRVSYDNQHNAPDWLIPFSFPGHPQFPDDALARFDEDGNGVLCFTIDTSGFAPDYCLLFRSVSHDFGTTWSLFEQITLTQSAMSGGYRPSFQIANHGKLWSIVWTDSCRELPHNVPPYAQSWRILLSANRGQSWYPYTEAMVMDTMRQTDGGGDDLFAELKEDRIRIYGFCNIWNRVLGHYYWRVEGTITADETPPQLSNVEPFPFLLPVDTTLSLAATAADNDSLWRVGLVVKRIGHPDSTLRLFTRTDSNFVLQYTTPRDSGEYFYYYFAEDMWENISIFPDSLNRIFWIGEVNAVSDPIQLLPNEAILRVHPNPFNHSTTITATLPLGTSDAVITIHDILGREVFHSDQLQNDGDGKVLLVWNASSGQSNGKSHIPASSGIYFVQLRAGSYHTITKITLLQ